MQQMKIVWNDHLGLPSLSDLKSRKDSDNSEALLARADIMLQSEPTGGSSEAKSLWKMLKPLNSQ